MSATPPKEKDVEAGVQSPEDPDAQIMNDQDPTSAIGFDFEVKEQDRWLPIANVARIMKMALPENAKIAKEAKECMQECVSEFISFITSEASEKCHLEKRKTVNGEDILFAMTSLGFENYAEALKIYLSKYREVTTHTSQTQSTRSDHPGPGGGRPPSQGYPGGSADANNFSADAEGVSAGPSEGEEHGNGNFDMYAAAPGGGRNGSTASETY